MESNKKTLFEKIIDGELPAKRLYEDDKIIAIEDKFPKAPVHVLIIPKKVIKDIQSMEEPDFPLLGNIVEVAQKLAKELKLDDGYRLVTNNGFAAGQTIFHLHFHLMGGHYLGGMG